ncbi:centrosomal protein of 164 kDa-like [Apostichopus japonicus]|uniref:centrosomal protein of 164 kDa-like n=1 Tax=Stichopus japonicus TaxID=307972 RepID=UPI003AB5EBF0
MMVGNQLVLEEDYDENYQPNEEDNLEYAQVVGINPDIEQELMWIAREGINAPLPNDWKPCQDTGGGDIYYFNFSTGESMWDHPCDEFYRTMVAEEREKMKLEDRRKRQRRRRRRKTKKRNRRRNKRVY